MDNPQNFLDSISKRDGQKFLQGIEGANWANHRLLLFLALELTAGSSFPVVEYGCGDGSTEYIRGYCLERGRKFETYETAKEWAEKCNSTYIERWEASTVFSGPFSVAFIDLAPGEYRKIALSQLKNVAEIIVVHDTELGGQGDYKVEPLLQEFKYRINYNLTQGGAGVTAVSNLIDLNIFDKCKLNQFLLEA